ncbi:Sng1p [Saccharomyces eubayanus]|uniref:Sng1p n=1 Tax=Saccharomyces eubayanus TaxID=1080349 RepID=UPI0006C4DA54|nr:SNG1-like protein [Saccharomyces eubayanus]KOG99683.1 SNG1-like protein [Saccharomyces eubayanus]
MSERENNIEDGKPLYIENPALEAAAAFTGGMDGASYCNRRFAEGLSHSSESAESLKDFRPGEVASSKSSKVEGGSNKKENGGGDGAPLERIKTGLFSPRLRKQREKILLKFGVNNFLIACLCISLISIYWGASYGTNRYFFKVKNIVVLQDVSSNSTVQSMSAIIPTLLASVPGTWRIYNTTSFNEKFGSTNSDEIDAKVVDLIYEEKYWLALNVKPNATDTLYNSLITQDVNSLFNSSDFFQSVYESGRDPLSVRATILPLMQKLEALFQQYYTKEYLPSLMSNVTTTYNDASINTQNWASAGQLLFDYNDHRPFTDRILMAPLQVGLIYCILLTVLQLSLYGKLHGEMAKVLKPKHILIYRILVSWSTYFLLSIGFCTVSAIFRIDFTPAFGRGGFVVYWMSTWLVMMAVGGANENVLSLVIAYCPQFLSFWLMTWIILNISASFYPMALNNDFYRYGYIMPIHNAVDIYKVIFLNLTRRKMGRNYGILVAWVALNTCLLPFSMKFSGQKMQKNAMQAAEAAVAAHSAKKNHTDAKNDNPSQD